MSCIIWDKFKKNPGKWGFWIIATAGLLLRFEYLREFSQTVHFPFAIGPDVSEYNKRALELLQGIVFPAEPEIHAPLYSFFLAFCYKLTGFSIGAVRGIQLILNWAAFVALAELVRRLSNSWKLALIFLTLALFTPVLFFHQAELISESLLIPLAAGFFWLIYYAKNKPHKFFCAGIILGAMVLCHGLMNFFLIAEAGYFIVKKKWKHALLLIAGAAVVIVCVIAAKSIYYGKFTPVQSNSFFNLWIGHNPDASGGCYLRPAEWAAELKKFRLKSSERRVSENFLMAEEIGNFYRHYPEQILFMPVKKLILLLSPKEPIAGADPEYLIRITPIQRGGAGMMAAVMMLALAGIYFAWRKQESGYLHFYLLTGALSCGLILTVVSGRYRQGMMPGIIMLAASGAFYLGKKAWLLIVPCVIAGALLIPALAGDVRRNGEAASVIGEAHYRLKEFDKAKELLLIAERTGKQPERYANMLGAIAEENGDLLTASARYGQAIINAPEHHDGYLNLGHLYFYNFPELRQRSLDLIHEALRRNKELPSAYDMLGQHLAQQGDFKNALKMFEQALFYSPDNELYKKKVDLCRKLAEKRGKNAPEPSDR